MYLRNYMEDVVIDVLDILLKERDDDICNSHQSKLDIIAFSLNRLPPKYIVSERGFTHSFIEEINNTDWKTDVISVVNLGIDIISKRQRNHPENEEIEEGILNNKNNIKDPIENLFVTEEGVYYYNFPHIVGQVFDKDTLKPIENVKVKLYIDDKFAKSSESSWKNPYITKKVTQGFYSFWPKSVKLKSSNPLSKRFTFRLNFSKDNYYSHSKEFYIVVEPEKVHYRFIRRNFTEKIDTTILEKRKR
ncbi:MAG: late competence development ComFB family protein [Spirochaetota bacterium]